jgi:putative transposase
LLDEIERDGARQMLAAAWQAEVAAYVEQFADQRDDNGRRLVLSNGYHQPREVLTAADAVEVTAPRVNAVSILRPVSGRGLPKFYVSRQAPGG